MGFKSIMRVLKEINYQRYLAMEPLPPAADPYISLKGFRSEEFYHLFTAESIEYLKFLEKTT